MKLDQSVFEGAPEWAEWVCVDYLGNGTYCKTAPNFALALGEWIPTDLIMWQPIDDVVFDTAGWPDTGLIRRDRCGSCPNKTNGLCCGGAK